MYSQCPVCRFWRLDDEDFCPNCGYRELDHRGFVGMVGKAARPMAVAASLTVVPILTLPGLTRLLALVCDLFILVASLWLIVVQQLKHNERSGGSLIVEERRMQRRLSDLEIRYHALLELERRIKQHRHSEHMDGVAGMLNDTKDLLERYRLRYLVGLHKIELIRWRNKIDPLLHSWRRMEYREGRVLLDKVKSIIEEGSRYLEKMESLKLSRDEDGRKIIECIQETQRACRELYEGVLSQQARLTIKDVSPSESTDDTFEQVDRLFARIRKYDQRDMSEAFRESYEDLKVEFDRLKAESELSS